MRQQAQQIMQILEQAQYPVFFGGAGVSTDSGIPDFRGQDGLYRDGGEDAEDRLSADRLRRDPAGFFSYYRSHLLHPEARPNAVHTALAELERRGLLKAVITQNIDGLHQMAGSERVIELHGSSRRNFCVSCGREYEAAFLMQANAVPRCAACGGMVRPDVTLYGESPDGESFADAEEQIAMADVLIVAGTSLTVQPAASLVTGFQGDTLIILNDTPTEYDGLPDVIVRGNLTDFFESLL